MRQLSYRPKSSVISQKYFFQTFTYPYPLYAQRYLSSFEGKVPFNLVISLLTSHSLSLGYLDRPLDLEDHERIITRHWEHISKHLKPHEQEIYYQLTIDFLVEISSWCREHLLLLQPLRDLDTTEIFYYSHYLSDILDNYILVFSPYLDPTMSLSIVYP